MPVMIYTATRRHQDARLLSVEFKTDFTDLSLARAFAREFPKSAKMDAHIEFAQNGHRYGRALSVCDLEPTAKSPGASKSGISQYRAVMRAARKLAATSIRDLTVTYSPDNVRAAITTAAEFEDELRKAEDYNRNAPNLMSENTKRTIFGSSLDLD